MYEPLDPTTHRRLFMLLPCQVRTLMGIDDYQNAVRACVAPLAATDPKYRDFLLQFKDSVATGEKVEMFSQRLEHALGWPADRASVVARSIYRDCLGRAAVFYRIDLLNSQRDETLAGREFSPDEQEEEDIAEDKRKGRQTLGEFLQRMGIQS